AALGRLVRIGGRSDGDVVLLPAAPGELAPEHVGDVDLHANGAAVLVARRAVGPPLEGADVTERAAVRAAHVRVERPLERHALDAVQRRLAGLLAVLDPHAGTLANARSVAQAVRGPTDRLPILRPARWPTTCLDLTPRETGHDLRTTPPRRCGV